MSSTGISIPRIQVKILQWVNFGLILEPVGSSGPKVPKEAKINTFGTVQGGTTALTCPGQSYPTPAFRFDQLIKSFVCSTIRISQWSKITSKSLKVLKKLIT